jgi:hypothetical protein
VYTYVENEMKIDSEIICRKEPFGVVCQWIGDQRHGTATMCGTVLGKIRREDSFLDEERKVFKYGGLKLRCFGMVFGENGDGWDSFYVKLDNPHSQLYAIYRNQVEKALNFTARVERGVRAFKGLVLDRSPFSERLASKLL